MSASGAKETVVSKITVMRCKDFGGARSLAAGKRVHGALPCRSMSVLSDVN